MRALAELRIGQGFANALGDRQGIVQRCLIEQQRERVAAVTSNHVAASGEPFYNGRGLPQDDVAALVAVLVID